MPIRLTRAVKIIMIACFVGFVVQQTADQFLGGNLLGWLGLVPASFAFSHRFWQVLTYSFLHGDVLHLFLNLMMLAFIGTELESAWGMKRFLRFYFFCSIAAGLAYLGLQFIVGSTTGLHTPMVGASGAIYGLLMAYGLIFGERVLLFMMLFPMKAKHFVWILGGVEFMSSIYSGRGGLSSVAHLGGMIAGFAYLWGRASWIVAKRRREQNRETAQKSKRRAAAGHLKLVINNVRDAEKSSDSPDSSDPKTWH